MEATIGQTLREARERKGLSIREVNSVLHIHAAYLDALETEEFTKIPAPVYVRAFLREYGRFLGMDPEPLVQEYSSRFGGQQPASLNAGWTSAPPLANTGTGGGVGRVVVGTLIAVGLLVSSYAYLEFQKGKSAAEEATKPRAAATRPGKPAAGALPGVAAPVKPATPALPGTEAPAPGVPNMAPAQPSQGAAPAGGVAPTSAAGVPAATPGVLVVATADTRSWVRVRADGKTIFEGILEPDASRTWKAVKVLDVLAGNGGAVRAVVNGKDVGAIGKWGRRIERHFGPPAAPSAYVEPTGF